MFGLTNELLPFAYEYVSGVIIVNTKYNLPPRRGSTLRSLFSAPTLKRVGKMNMIVYKCMH